MQQDSPPCAQLKGSSRGLAPSSDQGLRGQGRREVREGGLLLWPFTSWATSSKVLHLFEPQFPQPEDEETTPHPTPTSVQLSEGRGTGARITPGATKRYVTAAHREGPGHSRNLSCLLTFSCTAVSSDACGHTLDSASTHNGPSTGATLHGSLQPQLRPELPRYTMVDIITAILTSQVSATPDTGGYANSPLSSFGSTTVSWFASSVCDHSRLLRAFLSPVVPCAALFFPFHTLPSRQTRSWNCNSRLSSLQAWG